MNIARFGSNKSRKSRSGGLEKMYSVVKCRYVAVYKNGLI